MYILVDTNVYLDFLLDRGEQSEIAKRFFINAYISQSKVFLSAMSMRDIGYIASKQFHSQSKGKEAQAKAYSLCQKMIDLSKSDAIEALYSDIKDYEDALLVESAKRELLDLIVTNNIKDYEKAGIPVWTPDYFNQIIENTGKL
ncbi:MAG: PIN domain-containing protein [Erysipelotrichaceae bacterium]|jgi:predicted nucleic acid-binding protein|nr:PIN domain-containing protein [Erysipelotrichaceae bacterium]